MKPMGTITGPELELKRVAMGVDQGPLARAAGVTQQTISRWENAARVREDKAKRYLEALATFGTIPTIVVSHDDRSAA